MMTQGDYEKAVEKMGQEPANPIGECFESSMAQLAFGEEPPEGVVLCHGLGIANMPGQEGTVIGHAWLEWNDEDGQRVALDTTWFKAMYASHYRKNLQLSYIVEYTRAEAISLWKSHDYPGPWDLRIKEITDAAKGASKIQN